MEQLVGRTVSAAAKTIVAPECAQQKPMFLESLDDEPIAWLCQSTESSSSSMHCPRIYYSIWVPPSIQFRGAIRHGNCFSLFSRIDQTNEHHFKLMTVCLNSVLQDLDGKAFRVARVGFTFCHFRQSQRWYLEQLCLYSKTNEPVLFCLHDYFVGFIYRSRENTPKCIRFSRIRLQTEPLLKYPSAKQLKAHLSQWSHTATGSTTLRLYRALRESGQSTHLTFFFMYSDSEKSFGEDLREKAVAAFSPEPDTVHMWPPKAADSVLNYCNS
ncbi:hypothetical protein F7725_022833, partial [Dissostichus mawsoni]